MKINSKKQTGIWIDGSKAIIIELNDGKEVISEIESEIENSVHHNKEGDKGSFMGAHHINNEKKFEERRKNQTEQYLNKVVAQVKHSDELFIMGPAEIKTKLRGKVESDRSLAPRLRAVETSEQMTMNQCVAKVKNFFS
jgi:stalled ribosome rescue protein Dom34